MGTIRPGFGPEFMNRPDGYPGLVRAYGLSFAHAPREMDRNLLYQAVAQGSLDLAAGDSTDGRIAHARPGRARGRSPLLPPVSSRPAGARGDAAALPQPRARPRPPCGKIDAETMRRMNYEVDRQAPRSGGGRAEFSVVDRLLDVRPFRERGRTAVPPRTSSMRPLGSALAPSGRDGKRQPASPPRRAEEPMGTRKSL